MPAALGLTRNSEARLALNARFPTTYGPFFRSEFGRQERNFLLERLLVKIVRRDAITIRRDGMAQRTTSNIPAERPFFRAGVVAAVWKDWTVETEGLELAAHHPIIEPVSDTRVRNGNFQCNDQATK